ncbi:hypothetical protein BJY04DRAFT_214255 [Aspergillus karnatakaensis]|uniref:BTB/POZ domain-containing protein n=1 Tax=Aspergillus karnatakaensis TaxID=1810916 RepID=UPI003CCE4B8A
MSLSVTPPRPKLPYRAFSASNTSAGRVRRVMNEERYTKEISPDLVVICQGFIFKLHRNVVCHQSRFFHAAIYNHEFREYRTQTIDLETDDLATMERIFSYLYTEDYKDNGHIKDISRNIRAIELGQTIANDHAPRHAPFNNIMVFITADRFQIPRLVVHAANKFRQWCTENWASDAFVEAVQQAMIIVPTHLTLLFYIIAETIQKNLTALGGSGRLRDLIGPHPGLGVVVLERYVKQEKLRQAERNTIVASITNRARRMTNCSNQGCRAPLDVRLDQDDYELRTVRCAHCKVRQW